MSDTETWRPCGYEWINFGAWVIGGLDNSEECAVEAQFAACDGCWDQLTKTITDSTLLYEAAAAARG